jgi:hypothetical protein
LALEINNQNVIQTLFDYLMRLAGLLARGQLFGNPAPRRRGLEFQLPQTYFNYLTQTSEAVWSLVQSLALLAEQFGA